MTEENKEEFVPEVVVELQEVEALRVSKALGMRNVLAYTMADIEKSMETVNNDIAEYKKRIEYEESRLKAYEQGLTSVTGAAQAEDTELGKVLEEVAFRLDMDVEEIRVLNIRSNGSGQITHLESAPPSDEPPTE
mgnify:CR=1 FL=1